jgi:predicted transcriptional regulator
MVLKFQAYSGGGPTPKFTLFHIWKTYDIINEKGPIGRKALSQTLGIGEGSTRTILDKMMREGSVENTKLGAVLTDRGLKQFRNSGITAATVKIDGLTISSQDCAVLVKGMADRITTGYEQRDEAVRAGAVGATTLIFKDASSSSPPTLSNRTRSSSPPSGRHSPSNRTTWSSSAPPIHMRSRKRGRSPQPSPWGTRPSLAGKRALPEG